MNKKEPLNQLSNDRVRVLKEEVNSTPIDKVSDLSKALLAAELIKEALRSNTISLQQSIDFANSLIDYNAVPVIIGTPEKKIFPIQTIVNSRPAMIENTKNFTAKAGIDLEVRCQELKAQAQRLSDLLEIGFDWIESNYNPFKLSPEDIVKEVFSRVEKHEDTKKMLYVDKEIGGEEEFARKKKAVVSFIKLNFSNFIVGQDLLNHLKRNYKLK